MEREKLRQNFLAVDGRLAIEVHVVELVHHMVDQREQASRIFVLEHVLQAALEISSTTSTICFYLQEG